MNENAIKERLEYLRGEIEADSISYGEIAELQELAEYIEEGDVLLLEWAGVEEDDKICRHCGKRHKNALCSGGMR